MRPDAHKKKASTQYKKKHGLSSDKKPNVGGGRPKTGSRETGAESVSWESCGTGSFVGGQDGAGTSLSLRAATSHPQMVSAAAPSFRRREVTSNWNRYEELEDTQVDVTTMPDKLRGADFGLLLKVASSSSSQFRFADEQDWEGDDSDPCSFLSVDCADLSEALHCEPLHIRLGLNTDTFSEDQIRRFTAAAKRRKMGYKRKAKSAVVTCLDSIDEPHLDSVGGDSDKECSDASSGGDSEDESAMVTKAVPQQVTEMAPKTSPVNSVSSRTPEILTPPLATALPVPTSDPQNKPTKPNPAVDNAEDDLDFLLSLEEPVKCEDKDTLHLESDDLGKPCKSQSSEPKRDSPTEPQAKITVTQTSKTSTTNLEDWLDDFLDD